MNIEMLNEKSTLAQITAKVNELCKAQNKVVDRRGPKSEREMTDADALQIVSGDLRDASHKNAAEQLGLSYAQVYSCRKQFTFKHIHKAIKDAQTA